MNVVVKLIITALLVLLVVIPYFQEGITPGGLNELQSLGLIPSIAVIIVFFGAIAFYCRDLQRTLELIQDKNRTQKPKSVWYMYLIPFNFIEDFFIVIDIANSLKNEMKSNKNLQRFGDFGLTLGIGWSVAQVLSFFPSLVGQISGLVGLILWLIHWRLIYKINSVLKM